MISPIWNLEFRNGTCGPHCEAPTHLEFTVLVQKAPLKITFGRAFIKAHLTRL